MYFYRALFKGSFFIFEIKLVEVLKFILFIVVGIYMFRVIVLGGIRSFFNILKRQQRKTSPPNMHKERPNTHSMGEYIDYEEVD